MNLLSFGVGRDLSEVTEMAHGQARVSHAEVGKIIRTGKGCVLFAEKLGVESTAGTRDCVARELPSSVDSDYTTCTCV